MVNLSFKTAIDPEAAAAMVMGMQEVMDELLPGWEKDPSTQDTAKRFIKYLAEYRQPFDTEKVFGSTFICEEEFPQMVVQTPIPFRGMCEHHLLPMTGTAALGYVPKNKVLGLSKLTRLVDAVGVERPSLQEHIGNRIVDLMQEHLKPMGVMLVIKSKHGCMSCRGVQAPDTHTISSIVTGVFKEKVEARQEFLALVGDTL